MTQTINDTNPSEPARARLLRAIEAQLHDSAIGFQLDKARLYGATVNPSEIMDDADESFRLCFLDAHVDVYELLERPSSGVARVFDAAVLVTTGWATPINDDDAKGRRRVRLTVLVCNDGVVSGLRFSDEDADVLVDEGTATGALNDAVLEFWFGDSSALICGEGGKPDKFEG